MLKIFSSASLVMTETGQSVQFNQIGISSLFYTEDEAYRKVSHCEGEEIPLPEEW